MANIRVPQDFENDVKRSVHNLSTVKRTTIHPGPVYPIHSRKVRAGEKVSIDPTTLINSMPLQSQLLGSFKLELSVFFDSDANYYGWMDNNTRNTTESLLEKHRHRFTPPLLFNESDVPFDKWLAGDDEHFNQPHSMLDYMGHPVGAPVVVASFPAEDPPVVQQYDFGFAATYLNIIRNYFVNNQESRVPYITDLKVPVAGDGYLPEYVDLAYLDDIDDVFRELRYCRDGIDVLDIDSYTNRGAYMFLRDWISVFGREHGGLFLSTYQPDLFTNLLSSRLGAKSVVTVKDGQFDIDQLRFRNKLQRLIDRYDISGGRFSGWLRSVWGVKTKRDMDIPELIGVNSTIISPSQTVSTAQTTGEGGRELGAFGGNFDNYKRHKSHHFYCSTPGRVMVCLRLVPLPDYCQGLEPELREINFADEYSPEFAQKGFDKVSCADYSVMPIFDEQGNYNIGNSYPVSFAVGKQVSWLRMMTDVNRVHGLFASPFVGRGLDSWVLQRRYWHLVEDEQEGATKSQVNISQYIYPLDYQYPFQNHRLDTPNWQVQVALNIKAVLPIGKRFMPNLE